MSVLVITRTRHICGVLYYLSRRRLPSQKSDITSLERKAHLIQQLKMCQAFSATGADVQFVSPGTATPPWDFVSAYYGLSTEFDLKAARTPSVNYNFPNYPIPDADDLAVTFWLFYMVLSRGFDPGDVVYSRNLTPTRQLLRALDWTNLGNDISVWFEQHQVDRGAGARFYDRLDGVVCISERQEQRLHKNSPVDEGKTFVAHDGVDLDAYRGISTEAARSRLGIDRNELIVMYTGHLYPSKGVETLVRAAASFDANCYIVGGNPEDISRIKVETEIPDTVTFTGFVPPAKIPLYQMSADVLVATVADDTGAREFFSPLKIFEYMAAGKPLVVSRKPAYEEVLADGWNGLFVDPGSVPALAEAIEQLLSDPALRREFGRQAHSDAARYGWTVRARRILNEIAARV